MRLKYCIGIILIMAQPAFSQTGAGRIQGTVTDISTAVLPGAKVTATHLPTARQLVTTTN
jgi:hypothetical protein